MPNDASDRVAKVYLVGAGPGDPGLLTLRGLECLRRADVILYDYLVNPRILGLAGDDVVKTCLGRHGQGRIWAQTEINQTLVELARDGNTVVRLKGGDPAVFARGGEEIAALVEAGIEFEVVPGVTTALAASSYAGIPITHRKLASAVALVTGQEQLEKGSSALDFAALASFPGTLVFYMGVTTADRWTRELMEAGKSPQTPAAILKRCSLPDQRLVRCTLSEVAGRLASPDDPIRPPAVVILGDVVDVAAELSWFDRRPLFGQRIIVTRPVRQAEKLACLLEEQGAEVILQPAIEISPPNDWQQVDDVLNRLHHFDWLVFASVNGVRQILDRLSAVGRDVRALAGLRLASIGPGTTAELQRYSLEPDLQPARSRAESLAAALVEHANGKSFLLARGSRGREVLAEQLEAAGGVVESLAVYRSTDVAAADPEVLRRLAGGEIDWVTVTSSATAGAVIDLLGTHLQNCRLASISPITSEVLRERGFEPAVEAEHYSMQGLCDAIVNGTNS